MTAPVVEMEDDWTSFSEFNQGLYKVCKAGNESCDSNKVNMDFGLDNYRNDTKVYRSMEDLVHRFEESVAASFKFSPRSCDNSNEFKPLKEYSSTLASNEIWNQIVKDCGLVQPLDWSSSHIRELQLPVLRLSVQSCPADKKSKASHKTDKQQLREQFDLHNLTGCDLYHHQSDADADSDSEHQDCDVQTADEVIQELEEIMSDAVQQDAAYNDELEQQTGIIINESDLTLSEAVDDDNNDEVIQNACCDLVLQTSEDDSGRVSALKQMTLTELSDEIAHLEMTVQAYSENLLNQLNLREELLYGKEVRNTFISKTLEVQYKQEMFQQGKKSTEGQFKVRRLPRSFSLTNASSAAPGRYLTTVIPSGDGKAPSLEGLQVLIKLLDAIKEDSDEVPSLITNYILKYLCPSTSLHTLNL